jgi:hypothetical protein
MVPRFDYIDAMCGAKIMVGNRTLVDAPSSTFTQTPRYRGNTLDNVNVYVFDNPSVPRGTEIKDDEYPRAIVVSPNRSEIQLEMQLNMYDIGDTPCVVRLYMTSYTVFRTCDGMGAQPYGY